jgi:hypothetical protein
VIVTGVSRSSTTTAITIKYSGASGAVLWTAPITEGSPADIVVDSQGNVLVAVNKQTMFDTIKYSGKTGTVRWRVTYDGVPNNVDLAAAIEVDAVGDVVVAGHRIPASHDYVTVKYSGFNGALLWESSYNGPANGSDGPTDVAIDSNGDVIVTGASAGPSTGLDWATLKYDGRTGAQVWVSRFNGPANSNDEPRAIAVDASGDVFLTGFVRNLGNSLAIQALRLGHADGQVLWAASRGGVATNPQAEGRSLALFGDGDVLLAGYQYQVADAPDFLVARVDGAGGEFEWTANEGQIEAAASFEGQRAMTVDSEGRTAITGRGADSYVTALLAPDGETLWIARYPGSRNSQYQGVAVAFDHVGDVLVTGVAGARIVTIKYSGETGEEVWVAEYSGSGANSPRPTAIAVDATGDVLVAGQSFRYAGFIPPLINFNYVLVKYDGLTGLQSWEAIYDTGGHDVAHALAIDAAGNVFLTGQAGGSLISSRPSGPVMPGNFVTVKFDGQAGGVLWVATYEGAIPRANVAREIAVDGFGDVVVTGESEGLGTALDFATVINPAIK